MAYFLLDKLACLLLVFLFCNSCWQRACSNSTQDTCLAEASSHYSTSQNCSVPDEEAMFELFSSWFGSKTTKFCKEEFPKVDSFALQLQCIDWLYVIYDCGLTTNSPKLSIFFVVQVWTDFVDCFVDNVLAGGPVVAPRPPQQVSIIAWNSSTGVGFLLYCQHSTPCGVKAQGVCCRAERSLHFCRLFLD